MNLKFQSVTVWIGILKYQLSALNTASRSKKESVHTNLLIQAVSNPLSANPTAARNPAPPAPTTIALWTYYH